MPALLRLRPYAIAYAVALVALAIVAGDRLRRQSSDPHFVYQAEAWLHGEVAIRAPLKGDDWAKLETVTLDDGRQVRGRRLMSRPAFRIAGGGEVATARIKSSQGQTAFMSFPPVPALVMLPVALASGRAGNDVVPTVLLAALVLPLALLCVRRLGAAGLAERSWTDSWWLAVTLAFGTVFFFAAVGGKVWFTAHVVGVVLALLYAWAATGAAHPVVAGLALGLAALTRTPMAFMFPWFVLEAWRVAGGAAAWRADRAAVVRAVRGPLVRFAAPVVVLAVVAMIYNHARFAAPTEFGHSYLEVRQQAQIEAHGLFSYQYLARNLAVAFTLLPELPGRAPWIQVSGHGLAMWVTTPLLLLLLWPARRGPAHRALWLTVAAVALPTFFYQNSGWVQFGYRFSLDYLPFLVLLLAVGGRPLGRWARLLIVVGVVINLAGAWTFGRSGEYYRVGGRAYDTVVAH